jgi:hypothetical protein
MTVRRQIVEKDEMYFITFPNVYDEPGKGNDYE